MQANIHPDYHEINVVFPSGKKTTIRSTYGKAGDTLQLDVDWENHPAWTGGGVQINTKAGRVAKFKERFAGISATTSNNANEEEDN